MMVGAGTNAAVTSQPDSFVPAPVRSTDYAVAHADPAADIAACQAILAEGSKSFHGPNKAPAPAIVRAFLCGMLRRFFEYFNNIGHRSVWLCRL